MDWLFKYFRCKNPLCHEMELQNTNRGYESALAETRMRAHRLHLLWVVLSPLQAAGTPRSFPDHGTLKTS